MMKILEELDYRLYSEALDQHIKHFTHMLYESASYEIVINTIQAFTALFTDTNISKNIRLILSNSREVKALFEWVLKDHPEDIIKCRAIPKAIQLLNVFYVA